MCMSSTVPLSDWYCCLFMLLSLFIYIYLLLFSFFILLFFFVFSFLFFLLFLFFFLFFFFFSSRRRHTRYIGDWSSDVCSSDLTPRVLLYYIIPIYIRDFTSAIIIVVVRYATHRLIIIYILHQI